MDKKIALSDFEKVKQWGTSASLDDDLILLSDVSHLPQMTEPRRLNFIVIGLCQQGSARYMLDTEEKIINQGDIIIVSDRHVVDHVTSSDDFECVGMALSMKFFYEVIREVSDISALFLYSRYHPVMSLSEQEQQMFHDDFKILNKKITETQNHFHKELMRTLILAMFYDLSNIIYRAQSIKEDHQTRSDIIFTRFIRLVEENCRQQRRVSWYAQQMNITPKYLSQSVRNVSGRTPNTWIDSYVTLELRLALKNSTKSIKEITIDFNFPNQSFMGKYFKEHTGMSPSDYRKN